MINKTVLPQGSVSALAMSHVHRFVPESISKVYYMQLFSNAQDSSVKIENPWRLVTGMARKLMGPNGFTLQDAGIHYYTIQYTDIDKFNKLRFI